MENTPPEILIVPTSDNEDEEKGMIVKKTHLEPPETPLGSSLKRSLSQLSVVSSVSNFLAQSWNSAVEGSSVGLLLAVCSGILLTLYGSLLASIKNEIDRNTVLFLRGVIQSIAMVTIMISTNKPFTAQGSSKKWVIYTILIITTSIGCGRLMLLFEAFQKIPITCVQAIINAAPVLVMFLSHFILDDPYNFLRVITSLSFITGIIFVFQPYKAMIGQPMNMETFQGYLIAIYALICSSLGNVLTKKLTGSFDKSAINFYLGIFISLGSALAMATSGATLGELFPKASLRVWLIAFAVAAMGTTQQVFLVWALKLESSSRVAMARSIQILLAFLIQVSNGDSVDLEQLVGAVIIMITIFLSASEKSLIGKRPYLGKSLPKCNLFSTNNDSREEKGKVENGCEESTLLRKKDGTNQKNNVIKIV